MYPVMLDVRRRRVVIVGGGAVAARKAAGLIEAGATDVTVVAPSICDRLPQSVRRIESAYEPRHLDGAELVFAATAQAAVNAAVMADAARRGIWANRADGEESGDFVTVAKAVAGPIVLTVSAGSAALSASIRDELTRRLDPRWIAMAKAMTTLRPLIRDNLPPQRRREVLRALTTEAALSELERGGVEALKVWIRQFAAPPAGEQGEQ